jgi:Ala-tRNA(Pro) deacylase
MTEDQGKEQEEKVTAFLKGLGIDFVRIEHPPAATVEEAERYWTGLRGAHVKNIFLRNWKGNRHYLLLVEAAKKVDLKHLNGVLGEDRLSFASERRLKACLGVSPGAVSPFGLINDAGKEVRVIIDSDLRTSPYLAFHPNVNTATLEISGPDFIKYLEACGNIVRWLELREKEP